MALAMSGNTKVLTGLMERRALEAAFGGLAEINDPVQLKRRAREIAQSGSAALPVLLAMLDTNNPQLRGGLGEVARLLDRNAIVPALRGVATAPNSPGRARLSALTILDRYLQEPVDAQLLASWDDPDAAARQSLAELLDAMERDPYAILEYMAQLSDQPAEVPHLILAAIPPLLPNPHLITLLRLLAQESDAALGREAIVRLGLTRTGDAARALASLAATLPAERAALAERNLRKLRMIGVSEGEANPEIEPWSMPPVTERALITPLDPSGAQLVWLISSPDADGRRRVVAIVLQNDADVIACADLRKIAASELPPSRPIGSVHRLEAPAGSASPLLLETGCATAAGMLAEAVASNWRNNHPLPLEYRLISPGIWSGADPRSATEHDEIADMAPATAGDPVALLDHPAFAGWHWWPAVRFPAALWRQPNAEELLLPLAVEQFTADARAGYAQRLHAMARWLALAGDRDAAALALLAAAQVEERAPDANPFVMRLLSAGFELARLRYSTIQM